MEKWQKGAKAVLSLSGEGKNKYFAKFPERKDWFEKNYPEHFGRSVAKATSSLNKVTAQNVMNAKDAARKISQLRYQKALEMSSERVRSMGERRRESGEGLGGGLESNKDIISHVKKYGSIKAGRLGGSLYENSEKLDEFIVPLIARGLALAGSAALAPAETALGGLAYLGTRAALSRGGIIARGAKAAKGAKATKAAAERAAKIESGAQQVGLAVPAVDWLYGSPLANKIGPVAKPIGDKLQSAFSTAYEKTRFGSDPIAGEKSSSTSSTPSSGEDEEEIDYSTPLLDTEVGGKPKTNFYGIREERIATNAKALAEKIIATKGLQECMPMPISMMMLRSKLNSKDSENESSEANEEPGEYDYEGDMAKSQLRSIAYNSKMLHDMLEDNTNLPEWVQSKITLAEDYIMTAANYMRGELSEEVEQVEEKYMGFKAVEKAAAEGGARDPAAVAAAIGRKKYGKEKFQAAAAAGKKLGEETEDVNAVHRSMEKDMEEDLPFDPTGKRTPGNVVDKSGAVHSPMSRVRHLAQMAAMKAQMAQQKPETAEDLVAQHQALHTLEEKMDLKKAKMGDVIKDFQDSDAPQFKGKSKEKRRQMAIAAKLSADRGSRMDEEMTLDQAKKDPRYKTDAKFRAEVDKAEAFAAGFDQSNDMISPSMLPDTPTIPAGQGFGDDLTAQKKAKAPAPKKKMPASDNYDMVNRGALPDVPMKEESAPVSDNPYVAAAAGFLKNTSNRFLYGERK